MTHQAGERAVKAMARRLAVETAPQVLSCVDYVDKLERTLREMGVGELVELFASSFHALRSYQYGNASPDLAKEVADKLDAAMAKVLKAGG